MSGADRKALLLDLKKDYILVYGGTMKLKESVKPISHVKAHMSEIVENLSKSHKMVIITHNGEAKAVLQDIESYEELQDSLALLKILAMSTKSMVEEKGQSVEDTFESVRNSIKNANANEK